MSERIDQLLEVIGEVRQRYLKDISPTTIRKIRLQAVKKVADRQRITDSSVATKYIRELNPPVRSAADFDQLLTTWLREGSNKLQIVLDKHAVDDKDKETIRQFFGMQNISQDDRKTAQASEKVSKSNVHDDRPIEEVGNSITNTPTASDIAESSHPERVKQEIYRILRDTTLARFIKQLYEYKCQICGETILLPNGEYYAEAHHIKPLGAPYNGPDVRENILCLCPNHHVQMDYGAIALNLSSLNIHPRHSIGMVYLEYHNEHIYISQNHR